MRRILLAVAVFVCLSVSVGAWGVRGHSVANRAAVDALPPDGPTFLKEFRD